MGVPRRPSAPVLHAILTSLGVVATLLAGAAVIGSLVLHAGPFAAVEACQGFVASHATTGWLLVLGLAVLVALVALRAGRTLRAHLRARRRVRAALARSTARTLLGRPVHVVATSRPLAFCSGFARPRVYVSSGALALLGREELHALLAHEHHHAARRDPLRRLLADVLAESLIFLPVLRPLTDRRAALAELRADAAAVEACGGDVRPLAGALLSFEDAALGVDPERVDRLEGVRTSWTPPTAPLMRAFAALAGVLAIPVLAVERTTGAALDLAPFGIDVCLAAVVAFPFVVAVLAVAGTARGSAGTVTA